MKFLRELYPTDNPRGPAGNADLDTKTPVNTPQDADDVNVGDQGDDQNAVQQAIQSQSQNPDRQGLIRTVKGARLVYKRESEAGGFEELWIYNVSSLKDGMKIRRAILAGTDIPPNQSTSLDGAQEYTQWTAGNAEMLKITGLQN